MPGKPSGAGPRDLRPITKRFASERGRFAVRPQGAAAFDAMPQKTEQARATPTAGATHGQLVLVRVARFSLACFLAALVGCASVPGPDGAPEPVEPEAQPEPSPDPGVPEPAPDPGEIAPGSFSSRAAIVMSDGSEAFERVAVELEYRLDSPLVFNLARSTSPADIFATVAESDAAVVIAIGFPATRAAARWSTVPVIYCQVFNFVADGPPGVPVRGVASMPPLAAQLDAWRQHNPELRSVGAILGEGHQSLIEEATHATGAQGVQFRYETAGSDRETLYLFKRIAPDIDGFWLFPDNRILSLPVLKKVVDVAARHRVEIAVFNDALLALGVSLSTAAVESDIATTVLAVAAKLTAHGPEAVPHLTPLQEVRMRKPDGKTGPAAPGRAVTGGMSGSRP